MLPYKSLQAFSEVLVKKTCTCISAYEIYSVILVTNFYRVLMSVCLCVCVCVCVCLSVITITKKIMVQFT